MSAGSRRRLRLLYIACFDPTNIANGTSARGRAMLDALLDRFEVSLACLEGQFPPKPDVRLAARLAAHRPVPFTRGSYYLGSLRLYREPERLAREWRPQVVIADLDKPGLYAAIVGRRHSVPFIYTSHNVEYRRCLNLAAGNPARLLFVPWVWLCA